jgi:hypothetical protein
MFSKSMRRIRPQLEELATAFEQVEMLDPLQKSTLILITDENEPGSLKEVKTTDGTFQVIAGCRTGLSDDGLREELSKIVRATVELSSFSKPDRLAFIEIIESWAKNEPRANL